MVLYLLIFLIGLGALPSILGLLMIYHVLIRTKKSPADGSNRINHIRLVWFALTREDKFVYEFPWMKNDEWDNINNK